MPERERHESPYLNQVLKISFGENTPIHEYRVTQINPDGLGKRITVELVSDPNVTRVITTQDIASNKVILHL